MPDCYLRLRLDPPDQTEPAGVLIVSPAALLHPAVPQPDGTVLYELVTGHLVRAAHELVFLTDLAVELRAWPSGTWARLGLDPQAAAGAVITAWQRGHLKGLQLGGLTAEEALALERPAMAYGRAQLRERLARQPGGPGAGGCTPPADAARATASCSGGHPPAAAGSAGGHRGPRDRKVGPDRGHRTPRPTGRPRHYRSWRPSERLLAVVPARMPKAARLWPAGAAVPDWVRVRPHEVAWLRWLPQGPLLFTLVAGAREAAGHPSGLQIAANTGMAIDTSLATCAGHQPSGGRLFRKQRTVNPLVVPSHYNFLTAGQPMWDASTADAANACLQRIMAHGAGMAPIGSAAQGWYRAAA